MVVVCTLMEPVPHTRSLSLTPLFCPQVQGRDPVERGARGAKVCVGPGPRRALQAAAGGCVQVGRLGWLEGEFGMDGGSASQRKHAAGGPTGYRAIRSFG